MERRRPPCLARSSQPKHISRMQGHHSNNTTELSSIIEALSFLEPHGPVARDSQACIFHDCRHAASICLGTVQSRANVPLGLTWQRLLLQTQLRLRFTLQHVHSHAQNLGDMNVQTMRSRLVHLVSCQKSKHTHSLGTLFVRFHFSFCAM